MLYNNINNLVEKWWYKGCDIIKQMYTQRNIVNTKKLSFINAD